MTNELYMYLDGVERIIRRMTSGESVTKEELSRVKKTLDDLKLNSLEELRRSIFIQLRFLDDREEMNKIAQPVLEDYDKMSEEIKRRTVDEVRTGIRRGDSVSDIRSTLQSVLGFKDWRAKRIVQDTTGAISQAKRIQQGNKSGMNFRYTGPPAERQFCMEHLDKVYTLEQIEKMDNGQGLPVKYYGGGYNCRHVWVPVAPLTLDELNKQNAEKLIEDEAREKIAESVKFPQFSSDPEIQQQKVKEVIDTLYRLINRFGMKKLKSFVPDSDPRNAFYSPSRDEIGIGEKVVDYLNTQYLNNFPGVEPTKVHSYYLSKNIEDVLVHEFGHRLHDRHSAELNTALGDNWLQNYSSYLTDRGVDNHYEAIAELFSKYYHGKDVPDKIGKLFKKYESKGKKEDGTQ